MDPQAAEVISPHVKDPLGLLQVQETSVAPRTSPFRPMDVFRGKLKMDHNLKICVCLFVILKFDKKCNCPRLGPRNTSLEALA